MLTTSEIEILWRITRTLEAIEKSTRESRVILDSMKADTARMAGASEESNRLLQLRAEEQP